MNSALFYLDKGVAMLGDLIVQQKIVLTIQLVSVKEIILFLEFSSPLFLPGVLIYNFGPRFMSVFTSTVGLDRTCIHRRACCFLKVEIEGSIFITVERQSEFISLGLVGNKGWGKRRNNNCFTNNVWQRNSLRANNATSKIREIFGPLYDVKVLRNHRHFRISCILL